MPHFLARGARRTDGQPVGVVVHSSSEQSAVLAATDAGVLVRSVVALDAGEPDPADSGRPSALFRLATRSSKQGRIDDAITIMEQALKSEMATGVRQGISLYLRIPRYLIAAGRNDEAWKYLNRLKLGEVPDAGRLSFIPADLSDIHAHMARVLKAEKRIAQQQCHEALRDVAFVMNECMIASDDLRLHGRLSARATVDNRDDAVEQVADALAVAVPDKVEAKRLAEEIVGRGSLAAGWGPMEAVSRAERLLYAILPGARRE